MAEYLVASGSRKISQLTQITALSQSAVIPVVMGTSYPITNGTTNQISYENFRSSVILNNANTFIQSQNIEFGSQKITVGANTLATASLRILSTRAYGADFELFNNTSTDENLFYVSAEGSTAGVNFYYADTSDINNYVNFLSVSTKNGIVSLKRPTVITGSLTVTGGITANEYIVNSTVYTVTQSFSSGSTIFGNSSDDTHQITGSLKVSGSIALNTLTQNRVLLVGSNGTLSDSSTFTYNGTTLAVGSNLTIAQSTGDLTTTGYVSINSNGLKVDGTINNPLIGAVTGALLQRTDALNTFTSSQIGVNNVISAVTASINQFTSSQIGVNNTIAIVTASLNSFTASSGVSNNALNLFTSSQIGVNNVLAGVTSSLNTFTSSQIGVNNVISAVTASLNTYTSSNDSIINRIWMATGSLNTYTSSNNTIIGRIWMATGSLNTYTSSNDSIINRIWMTTSSLNTYTSSNDTIIGRIWMATASLNTFTSSIREEINLIESYTASLKAAAIVSSSTQITNYYKFAETASANTFYGNQTITGSVNVSSNIIGAANVQANKFVFTDGVINTNVGGQYVIATSGNVTYLYTGTSGLNINDATNGNINVSISNVGAVQTRGKLTVGSPGNDQDIAFGGSNAKLDWAGTGAQIFYSVGALQFSSVGSTNNMVLQQNGGALFNAGITGSLLATNNVVSSSTQILNYNLFAVTSSNNIFYGLQTITGSLIVSGGHTVIKDDLEVTGGLLLLGAQKVTGSIDLTGSIYVNGNNNSGFFYNGNRQFNYAQFYNTTTMSGSADTAYSMSFTNTDSAVTSDSTIYLASGSRIYVKNTGIYNLQFSAQLGTTATETCEFSIWFAITGSDIGNSNTDVTVNKSAGGGNTIAAWNLLIPLQSGSFTEIRYSKTTANGQITAKATQSTPTRPATPSVIATLTQVG